MSISMNVTRMILNEKIEEGKSFSLEEIMNEITIQGGSKNIYEGVSVESYILNLKKKGILRYNLLENTYIINPDLKDIN